MPKFHGERTTKREGERVGKSWIEREKEGGRKKEKRRNRWGGERKSVRKNGGRERERREDIQRNICISGFWAEIPRAKK